MRPAAGPTPIRRDGGRRGLVVCSLLAILSAACGGPRVPANLTPTLIPQPTPDRTVDAVVRGLVTVSVPGQAGTPGTPGAATTPGPRTTAAVAGVTPAGTSSTALLGTPTNGAILRDTAVRTTAAALPASATAAPATATRAPTMDVARAAATETAPVATRVASPTPAPVRQAVPPTSRPQLPAPTTAPALATPLPPPTFGRASGASGLVRP
jgi:hypothetical protein